MSASVAGSFCLVTKTYAGDLEAFRLLCESIDAVMPEIRHYVVIDRADAALLAPFASPQRELLVSEDLLPGFVPINLLGRRLWYHWPHYLVRGWIFQQLAKLKAVSLLEQDVAVVVDSDTAFLRPITPGHIFAGDKVRLFHRPGAQSGPASQSDKWHDAASAALGLPQRGYTGADYISPVNAWSPAVVRALLAHVEQTTGRVWHDELLRNFRFSECVLYGVYCDYVEGAHQQKVTHTQQPLCHCSWGYDFTSADEIAAYVADFAPDKVAAQIQSNLGLPHGDVKRIFERLRQRLANG